MRHCTTGRRSVGDDPCWPYGTSWTAAHLAARAILFRDDAAALFQVYTQARSSPAEDTWYRMTVAPIAGPLMVALLQGGPPRVA